MRLAAIGIALITVASGACAQAGNVTSYPAAFFAALKPNTAYDMVLRVPGFTLDDGSAVRGLSGAAGNVLIDGQRPVSKSDDLISILKRLSASQIERIDLIRGATPGIDMQGKTEVANVVLQKAGGFSGSASYGQYTVRQGYKDPNVHLDTSWRKNDRRVEASLLAFQGHLNTEGPGPHEIRGPQGDLIDRSRTNNSEPSWEYKVTAAVETPLAEGRLRTNVSFDAQPYNLTSTDNFQFAGRQEERDHQTLNVGELGLHYNRDLIRHLSAELSGLQQLSGTDFRSDFQTSLEDQRFHLDNRQSESVGRLELHWQPSLKLTGQGGGEYAYNVLTAATDFTVNGTPVALPAANVRVTEKRAEAFATLTWRAFDKLSIEAAMRYETSIISATGDVVSSRRLTFAKPRLLLTWSPNSSDQLRVRVEREVSQLAFNQFVATASLNSTGIAAGNPNLLPQQDWAVEAAFDHHFWRDGIVSLTVRRLALADVIDRAPVFAPSGIFDAPANIGSGAETDLVANFSMPLSRIGLSGVIVRGTATWRNSSVTDPTTDERRAVSGQHRIDAEVHLTQDLPHWNINWGIDILPSARERFFRFNEIDTNHIGGFASVFVDYKPRRNLTFRVQLYTHNRFEADRAIFGGPRNNSGVQITDIQKRTFGPLVFINVRRTF